MECICEPDHCWDEECEVCAPLDPEAPCPADTSIDND